MFESLNPAKPSLLNRISGALVGGILGMFTAPIALPVEFFIKSVNSGKDRDDQDKGDDKGISIFPLLLFTPMFVPLMFLAGVFWGLAHGISWGFTDGFTAGLSAPKKLFNFKNSKKTAEEVAAEDDKANTLLSNIRMSLAKNDWMTDSKQLKSDIEELDQVVSKLKEMGYTFNDKFKNEVLFLMGKFCLNSNQTKEAKKYLQQIPVKSHFSPNAQSLLNSMQEYKIPARKVENKSILQKIMHFDNAIAAKDLSQTTHLDDNGDNSSTIELTEVFISTANNRNNFHNFTKIQKSGTEYNQVETLVFNA